MSVVQTFARTEVDMTGAALKADSRMVHCQCRVPPILRIPCEITSEIFQHSLPEDEFPRPSVKSGPVQLSHVCSTWRKLVIRTPRLWSKILLCTSTQESEDTKGSYTADMKSHVKALEVWMRRAESLLLSVHIRYPTYSPDLPPSEIDEVPLLFMVIVKRATRWKDVRFDLPGKSLAFAFLLTQQNVSKLETFHINDTSGPAFGFGLYFPVCLKEHTAGTLTALSLHGAIAYAPNNPAPFVRLRTVSLKHSLPERCFELLKYCPILEDLNLSFYDLHEAAIPSEYPTIMLPQLLNFHLSHTVNSGNGNGVRASQAGEIGVILDSLQLPRLQSFNLWMTIMGSARYQDPNLPWDYLSRLIARSNCSLSRLELQSPHLDTPSILECLRLSPDLKCLGIPADEELERNVAQLLPSLDSLYIFKWSTS